MGETQATTKNWMGSLLEGQRDAGGQMYMRNRYYDPGTGQFTQTDPIGIAGGLNTYGFAAGDPVGNWDPFGLCSWGIGPDAAFGRCGENDGAAHQERGHQDPKKHGRCEVAGILRNYIHSLARNPIRFAAFGDRDYPAEFDFKINKAGDLFEAEGQWLRADEFGHYAAGYAGQHVFGRAGYTAMIFGGKSFAKDAGSGEAPDDSESRPMIDGGAQRAALEQANNGAFVQFNNGGYRRPYIEPLTSRAGCTNGAS